MSVAPGATLEPRFLPDPIDSEKRTVMPSVIEFSDTMRNASDYS
jgi:hypothetical protein